MISISDISLNNFCVTPSLYYGSVSRIKIKLKKQKYIYKKEVSVAEIAYIKEGSAKGRVTIGLSLDGECRAYSVTIATYSAIGAPGRYSDISERDVDAIVAEDERYRAMKRAVSLLAASDKSAYTVKTRLRQAGFSYESAEAAVEECMARGYIDEGRQLRRLIEREANDSLRGKYYIKKKLLARGYRSADIDRAMRCLVEDGELDFSANFERLSEKKCAFDEESRRQLAYKYGYKL